jgi:hypothetical protein
MAAFERELGVLLREVGRRIVAWVLNHLEPEGPEEAPSRLWVKGRAYRRRRKHRTSLATLFGPVVVWRRRDEPLERGARSMHPLEIRVGIAAGLATPALAERIGGWAAAHTQRQVLAMLTHDHGVQWSCTTLRKLLGSLSAALGTHRQAAQVDSSGALAPPGTGGHRPVAADPGSGSGWGQCAAAPRGMEGGGDRDGVGVRPPW